MRSVLGVFDGYVVPFIDNILGKYLEALARIKTG